jgi:hypothetical protein
MLLISHISQNITESTFRRKDYITMSTSSQRDNISQFLIKNFSGLKSVLKTFLHNFNMTFQKNKVQGQNRHFHMMYIYLGKKIIHVFAQLDKTVSHSAFQNPKPQVIHKCIFSEMVFVKSRKFSSICCMVKKYTYSMELNKHVAKQSFENLRNSP